MKKKPAIVLVSLVILAACSYNSTSVTGSWKNQALVSEAKTKNYRSVFIAAMCGNIELRSKLENALAAKASQRNIKTIKSSEYYVPTFSKGNVPSKDEVLRNIRKTGAETILLVTLLDQKTETRYVPGAGPYAPVPAYGWYGGFYSYYSYRYPMAYDPGYMVTDKLYYFETNLYDVNTEQLIWSAQSETVNPGSTDAFIIDFSNAITQQMVKDGVLKPLNQPKTQ